MKRFVTMGLTVVIVLLSLCGCDIMDTVSQLEFDETKEVDIETFTEEYGVFSPEFDSCYNSLSFPQKEMYEKIYSICEGMPVGYVRVCEEYDDAVRDIAVAYRAVLNDHAEIFWMPDTYIVSRKSNGGYKRQVRIAFEYTKNGKSAKYPVTRKERDKMRKQLNEVVSLVVKEARKLDGQFEKEKYFNDYICKNTTYGSDERFINTSYGCLVNKHALCEGYSRAFKLLCNEVEIECDLIVGVAEGEGHMWNSVNIDGMHNYVDVSWNDRPDFPYLYFNITEEQLSYDHTLSPLYTEVSFEKIKSGISYNFVKRDCSYLSNSYYQKYGRVLGDELDSGYAEDAAKQITDNFRKGKNGTDFWLKSEKIKKEFLYDEKNFIKNIQNELNDIRIDSYTFRRDVLIIYCEK